MGLFDWVKNLFGGSKEEAASMDEAAEEGQVESTEASEPAEDETVQ